MDFREAIQVYAEGLLTMQIMKDLLRDYKRPNDKINELVKKGELTPVKKGLYVPGPKSRIPGPQPFLVANHLWGPSYVSLETALAWWSFIPERVYEVSSITIKRARNFKTVIGRFSYLHAPLPYYTFGIKSVVLSGKQVALIASPEKAICDKIVMTAGIYLRSIKQVQEFLIDDLRIEEEALKKINSEEINRWIDNAPKTESLRLLVKAIQNL